MGFDQGKHSGWPFERHCALVGHVSNQRLQIYQHVCPAALRWLQRFNKLQEKVFMQYKADVA